MKLSSDIFNFFRKQAFVIVSTLDAGKKIHCSAKGIARINRQGKVYIIDLYRKKTFQNLKRNPTISITAIDEHRFVGYTLKGKGRIVEKKSVAENIVRDWKKRIIQRISKRLIKNIRKSRKAFYHPEALFPSIEYLIVMQVDEVVDLTPAHLKK